MHRALRVVESDSVSGLDLVTRVDLAAGSEFPVYARIVRREAARPGARVIRLPNKSDLVCEPERQTSLGDINDPKKSLGLVQYVGEATSDAELNCRFAAGPEIVRPRADDIVIAAVLTTTRFIPHDQALRTCHDSLSAPGSYACLQQGRPMRVERDEATGESVARPIAPGCVELGRLRECEGWRRSPDPREVIEIGFSDSDEPQQQQQAHAQSKKPRSQSPDVGAAAEAELRPRSPPPPPPPPPTSSRIRWVDSPQPQPERESDSELSDDSPHPQQGRARPPISTAHARRVAAGTSMLGPGGAALLKVRGRYPDPDGGEFALDVLLIAEEHTPPIAPESPRDIPMIDVLRTASLWAASGATPRCLDILLEEHVQRAYSERGRMMPLWRPEGVTTLDLLRHQLQGCIPRHPEVDSRGYARHTSRCVLGDRQVRVHAFDTRTYTLPVDHPPAHQTEKTEYVVNDKNRTQWLRFFMGLEGLPPKGPMRRALEASLGGAYSINLEIAEYDKMRALVLKRARKLGMRRAEWVAELCIPTGTPNTPWEPRARRSLVIQQSDAADYYTLLRMLAPNDHPERSPCAADLPGARCPACVIVYAGADHVDHIHRVLMRMEGGPDPPGPSMSARLDAKEHMSSSQLMSTKRTRMSEVIVRGRAPLETIGEMLAEMGLRPAERARADQGGGGGRMQIDQAPPEGGGPGGRRDETDDKRPRAEKRPRDSSELPRDALYAAPHERARPPNDVELESPAPPPDALPADASLQADRAFARRLDELRARLVEAESSIEARRDVCRVLADAGGWSRFYQKAQRRAIRVAAEREHAASGTLDQISQTPLLAEMLEAYDRRFFRGVLGAVFTELRAELDARCGEHGGACVSVVGERRAVIHVSLAALRRASSGPQVSVVGAVQAALEHELVHAVVRACCAECGGDSRCQITPFRLRPWAGVRPHDASGHSVWFLWIARNLFGQTVFQHCPPRPSTARETETNRRYVETLANGDRLRVDVGGHMGVIRTTLVRASKNTLTAQDAEGRRWTVTYDKVARP